MAVQDSAATEEVEAGARRSNRRLAIALGALALGLYLLMLFFNPA